ncbi:MAG TPA: carboxypeptidase regulatory-like domain-containing protein [Vicinamibacterales bacterium]|nr:carboxypeptidase regulatory-like domain-containing protein [Vicinamibacterales bacterium]
MRWTRGIAALAAVLVGMTTMAVSASAQITTGSVVGTITDAQGGALPGASVTLVSATKGTKSPVVVTNETGDFVVPNTPADTYTIEVVMSGFKTLNRSGITVNAGSRTSVGRLTLDVGGVSEVVDVTGEALAVQTTSGERSMTVPTDAVQNLPIATRSFDALISLTPGVSGTNRVGDTASTGGGDNNYTMDGVSTMDTGSNRLVMKVNVESIAEVKVLTSNYQAEYGRSSGLQVAAITKSGTNQFHGSLYDVERNSDWNANSERNILNGDPKGVSKQRDWGYSIGGPIGKPGGNNKLFFFYTQEFNPRTTGGNTQRWRMPTVLERQGDFSQTYDNLGNLYPYIRDASKSGACSASDQSACFADGGVLGRIPADRLYQTGLNILNHWPAPNIDGTGLAYNYVTQSATQKLTGWQPVVKLDYQPWSALRASFKYAAYGQADRTILGSIPGFNDTRQQNPVVFTDAATVDYTVNPTTFLEVVYGHSQAEEAGCALVGGSPQFCQNALQMNPTSDRNNIGLGDLPYIFPDATVINPDYYAYRVLNKVNPPIWDGSRLLLPPSFSWGNRVTNNPPNLGFPGYLNTIRTDDIAVNLTKVAGRHTLKAGFYNTHSYKAEQPNNNALGSINFSNDTNNPLDAQFGFANAALGTFDSYQQAPAYIEGNWVYNNTEWFVQDNWKFTDRLTLDYGLRFVHQQPQYDELGQTSNFLLDKWQPSAAPALYQAGCANNSYPCSGSARQALDPVTGALLGPNTALAIGTIVPNSGDEANGLFVAGQGIAKTTYTWPAVAVGPRFGMAYDVTGTQRLVLRGGGGLFFDRPSGNSVFPQASNPPFSGTVTVQYGQLQSLGSGGLTTKTPPALNIFQYDSPLPSSAQWNAGAQMALPWSTTLDVSYVGQHGYNIVTGVNINAVDFGTAYLDQYQDPTLTPSTTPGATAVTTNLMRPYQGYGSISSNQSFGWRTYHSLQISFQRRFVHGLSFGFNDTIGLYDHSSVGLRLEHNPDGTYTTRADQGDAQDLLGDNHPQTHILKANFVWQLPTLQADRSALRVLSYIINDWQLSGIWTASTGSYYTVGYSYQSNGGNVNITGSPDYAGRVRLVGDPGAGCSDDIYRQFNASAFAGPLPGSVGLESGNGYAQGCASSVLDFAIARTIRLGGGRSAQFRLDIFNAPNSAQITGRNTTVTLANPNTSTTAVNLPYDADGNLVSSRSKPSNAGFGMANAWQDPRTIQAQIRFSF